MPVIIGTSNPEVLVGTADADQIYGLGGNDILYGGEGDDSFFWQSGQGVDTVDGGPGNDTQIVLVPRGTAVGLGTDPADSSRARLAGFDQFLPAGVTLLTLTSVENFTMIMTGVEYAGLGVGPTPMSGTITLNATGAPLVGNAGVGFSGSSLTTTRMVGLGSPRADLLAGGAGNDVMYGYSGNDELHGGGGFNELAGGLGNDTYYAGASDSLIELAGEGTDRIMMSSDFYEMKANFESITYMGSGAFTGIGNALANYIEGRSGADYLIGLGGDDQLYGGDGSPNTLQGGTGSDYYYTGHIGDSIVEFAGEGIDTVVMAFATYTLAANVENLIYAGTAQTTRLTGNAEGNGITGRDFARDYLIGLEGNDRLEGFSGTDILDGGAGNDILIGGTGADEMAGGAGADMFVVSRFADGVDGIHDFSRSQGDKIDITAFTAEIGAPGADPFASGKLILQNVADFAGAPTTRVLYDPDGSAGPGGSILFLWAHGDALTSADFIF